MKTLKGWKIIAGRYRGVVVEVIRRAATSVTIHKIAGP